MNTHNSIYESITNTIIESLEAGVRPWNQPWESGSSALPIRSNNIPYQGINILILWIESFNKGYSNSKWMTFKQAQQLGANVKKGERGTRIFFSNVVEKTESDEDGNEKVHLQSYLRSYTVFNIDQIEGLDSEQYQQKCIHEVQEERKASLESFVQNTGAAITEGGDRACYFPNTDKIKIPSFTSFESPESYYATLCHELIHWTGHPTRLNRKLVSKSQIKEYAFEELVAELGSAFLGSNLGITPELPENHASYIASWINILNENHQLIFKAASLAQKAVNFLIQE